MQAAVSVARERAGTQFDPDLAETFAERRRVAVRRARLGVETWDAVLSADAGVSVLARRRRARRARSRRWPTSSTSSRRTRSATPGAWRLWPRPRSSPVRPRRARRRPSFGAPRWSTTSGGSGCPTRIWDKPGPLTPSELERVRMHPYLTERMLASSAGARAAGRGGRPAPRAARRLGLPARADRRRHHPRRAGCWRRPTATTPGSSRARTGRPQIARAGGIRSCEPTSARAGSTATPPRPCSPRPATAARSVASGRPA